MNTKIIGILTILIISVALLTVACTYKGSSKEIEEVKENDTSSNLSSVNSSEEKSYNESDFEFENKTTITLKDGATTSSNSSVKIDGDTIYIEDEGEYELTGTLSNGQIIVNAPKENVKLVLNNASITCNDSSPIYIYKSKNTMVYLKEGTNNYIEDGTTYTYNDDYSSEEDEEPNATLYSKSDLIISGSGTLKVKGNNKNGITSKDTLTIDGANIEVEAINNGINGKDSNTISNSNIIINAGGKGIRSSNDTDEGMGWISISNSTIKITAEEDGINATRNITINSGNLEISTNDDAIHADETLTVNGGNIKITKCYEGIEGTNIVINDGEIDLISSDDGINAKTKLTINGGTIIVNANGDGVDCNGQIEMNGGNVIVQGPTNSGNSAIDYERSFELTNGTVIAIGSSGMAQGIKTTDTQGSIVATLSKAQEAGTKIEIKDANGNVLEEITSEKRFSHIVFTSKDIIPNEKYSIYLNGNLESEVTASSDTSSSGFGGGRGQKNFENQGGFSRQDFNNMERPEMPEGFNEEDFKNFERPEMPEEFNEENFKNFKKQNRNGNFEGEERPFKNQNKTVETTEEKV